MDRDKKISARHADFDDLRPNFAVLFSEKKNSVFVKLIVMGESKQKKSKIASAPFNPNVKQGSDKSRMSRVIREMTYGKPQFKWMLIGIAFIVVGMILMSGGWMPSPDVWDESIIYSARRITFAPLCIIIGLAFQIYAIFKVD